MGCSLFGSAVMPTPPFNYTSPNSSGTLQFAPATNTSGTATIFVTARDNGGTNNGGVDTIIRQFTVTVIPTADLSISQVTLPNPGFLGGTITFKVTITNAGPTVATNIQVTNVLPQGIGSISVSSTQGTSTNDASTAITSLGTLTNGASATVTLVVEPLALGTYTNTAIISSPVTDPNPANNSSVLANAVVPAQFAIPATTLVSESCTNGGIDPAEMVTVSFALQNTGASATPTL